MELKQFYFLFAVWFLDFGNFQT